MTFFRYFFLTLASLLVLPLVAQTPTDPVAWLKAEGNATDATSFGNNGVVNGTVPYVAGKVGNAFNFTGNVANYIRIPNSASLQSSLLSVEYWVNFNSATNAANVAKRNGSSDAWQAGIVYSGGNFLLQFVGNTSGGLFDWYSGAIASPVGVWTHVAVTYDGSTVKGYINGSQVLTQAVTLQLSSRTADIFVGNYAGTSLPLDAKLDELSIYNRALSAAEVLAIFQAGSTGKTSPPTVTSISPSTGSTLGGTSVTITGTNLTGATAVTFGGNAATNVTVVNATTLTATTPARTAGTASVIVTTPGGSNPANSLYTYLAPGDLDPLNPALVGNYVLATAVQPDGKLILAGKFTSVLGVARNNLARLNADSTLDTSFNPNPNGDVNAVTIQPDGKILIGGSFTNVVATTRNRIARLNADGTLDTGFNPNIANGSVSSLVVQTDGKVLLGGDFTSLQPNGAASPTTRNRIARLNADGTLETGFDPNASDRVVSMAVQADGKILISGYFLTLQPNGAGSATTRNRIARLNADGTLDTGFNPNANNWVNSLALEPDGQILLGGDFTSLQPNGAASATTRNRIARLNADGTLDTGFNPNANGSVLGIAVQADGKVLLGGYFITLQPNGAASSTARNCIARVNADGTLDAAFDPKPNNALFGLALQADGQVLLGGLFSTLQPNGAASATPRSLFARVANDAAVSTVSVPSFSQVQWTRSGSAPEVSRVTFELSTDSGASWSALGYGTRVGSTSNWQLTGLSLPASGLVRARGATTHGYFNGSSGLVESTSTFLLPSAPTVTGISPTSGTTLGGTSVTITGTNFTGATAVTFGGNAATNVTVVNSTTITATTPARTAGTASVIVATPGGTNAANSLYTYVAPAPTVTSVSPNSGTTLGGTSVTLTGTNFTGATVVTFGGNAATNVTVVNSTTITATTPARTAGSASVIVATPGGTNTANSLFTYIATAPTVTGVSPSNGSISGGANVTITGTNFTGATAVTFDGNPATGITVVNDTTITATAPSHAAGAVSVVVTTPAGTNATNSLFTYIANTAPTFFLPYTQGDPSTPWTVRDIQRTYIAAAVSADGSKMAAVNYGGQIFTSTDGGITWVPRENNRLWRSIASSRDGKKLAAVAYGQRIYTSNDSGETWTPRESERNWVAITSSGSGDYLAAAVENGRIYYSSDSGATWTPREAARLYTSLDYSENGLRLAVAAEQDYLYVTHPFGYLTQLSSDIGQWRSAAASSDFTAIIGAEAGGYLLVTTGSVPVARLTDAYRSWMSVDVSGDGTKMGAVAYGDRIYLSSDSGVSWTPCESNRNWFFITTPTDGNGWVALADGRIYTSPRTAYTFTHPAHSSANVSGFVRNITAGPASESWQTVSFQVTNDNNALFTTQPAISSDGTLTFAAGTATGSATVTVTAQDNGGTLSGGVDTSITQTFIITLTPALPNVAPSFALRDLPAAPSAPWRLITEVPNPSGFALSADGRRILAGTRGYGLYISGDGGVTWTRHMDGFQATSVTSSADGMRLAAVSSSGGLWASVDGGATWNYRGYSNGIFALDASVNGLKLIASFIGAGTGLQTSPDGGITWVPRISGEIWNGVASSADGTKLAGVVRGGTIATSSDGGATWTRRMTDANRQWWSITSSADGTKLAAVVKGGSIYTSSDSGATWTARLTDANRQWYDITSSADGTKLAAAFQPGYIYLSTDSGLTWTTQASELYWFDIACSADGERLFAADEGYGLAYTNPRVLFAPSVAAGSGPSATSSMAQYISPGPAATESGQSVAFQVTNNNNALFLTQPAISGGGTLTFTPGYFAGTATVSVVAVDNGGTAYGGTDTSAPQTFTITVTPGTSPIEVWRQAQFGNATTRIGNTDDFDFDGLANLLEYGLVLSPTEKSSQPAVQLTTYPDGDRLRIILQRDPARSDVTIEVQASGDLTGTWATLATSTLGAPFTGPGYVNGDGAGQGLKTVEIRDTVNITDAPRRFLRVKVTR